MLFMESWVDSARKERGTVALVWFFVLFLFWSSFIILYLIGMHSIYKSFKAA